MVSDDGLLLVFSVLFAASIAAVLIVPIVKGKSDFFTTRNMFLVGAFVFTGMSGIRTTYWPHYHETYKTSDYFQFFLGVLVFYPAVLLTYHFWKTPRRLAGRNFLRWPSTDGVVLVFLALVCALSVGFQVVRVPIPIVGELLFQFSFAAAPIALTCAFIAWFRAKSNPLFLGLLLAVLALTIFSSMNGGMSRRALIGALATMPITLYWIWLRYKSNAQIVTWLIGAGAIALPIMMGYGMVRHMFSHEERALGLGERGIAILRELPNAIKQGGSLEGFMGQDSVECAIMTIHLLNDGSRRLEVDPFYAVVYALSNPIPRTLWPNKPDSLGIVLPEVSGLAARGINANLGINVVGQCYYDGGLHIHLLYGIVVGAFLRFFDELLVRQPGNPLLTGALGFMSGHLIGWNRGAIEVMGMQIALGFFALWGLSLLMRMVFGAGLVYPRTDHIVDYPLMRSPQDWMRWMQSYTSAAVAVTSGRPNRYAEADAA